MAKVLPKLIGPGQALRFVTAEGVEVEVEAVQTAIIAKSGITLTLAPGAAVASTIGNKTGGSDPGPRRPSREERFEELAKDPDRGGKVGPASERERDVALDLEDQGRLKAFVRRAKKSEGHSGDFVDGNEQDWDVKQPHSRAQLEELQRLKAVREGRPPPKFDPQKPLDGEFDLKTTLKDIHDQFASGENVIIDTSQLNAADLAALRQALADEGILGTKVLMYPCPASP